MVMQGTSAEGAMALAERTRVKIESYDWEALSPGLLVTASLGAALGSEAETSIELLALADRRLLSAKANGRNRVVGPASASADSSVSPAGTAGRRLAT
jgi:diguanylate cyclase (GGDEF)-like protein